MELKLLRYPNGCDIPMLGRGRIWLRSDQPQQGGASDGDSKSCPNDTRREGRAVTESGPEPVFDRRSHAGRVARHTRKTRLWLSRRAPWSGLVASALARLQVIPAPT
jgi:hypothetical protein